MALVRMANIALVKMVNMLLVRMANIALVKMVDMLLVRMANVFLVRMANMIWWYTCCAWFFLVQLSFSACQLTLLPIDQSPVSHINIPWQEASL